MAHFPPGPPVIIPRDYWGARAPGAGGCGVYRHSKPVAVFPGMLPEKARQESGLVRDLVILHQLSN